MNFFSPGGLSSADDYVWTNLITAAGLAPALPGTLPAHLANALPLLVPYFDEAISSIEDAEVLDAGSLALVVIALLPDSGAVKAARRVLPLLTFALVLIWRKQPAAYQSLQKDAWQWE